MASTAPRRPAAEVLEDLASTLLLHDLPFSRVVAVFAGHCDAHTKDISFEAFVASLKTLYERGTKAVLAKAVGPDARVDDAIALGHIDRLAPELYALFDTDASGGVNGLELSSALLALCGGEPRDKAVTLFRLSDADRSGTITPDEMRTFMKQVVSTQRALFPPLPEGGEELLGSPADVAAATTAACFAEADKDGDGTLTLDEYLAWYLGGSSGSSSSSSSSSSSDAPASDGQAGAAATPAS
jgi:Ca2+-binding EF-hand superfamily protein